MLKKKKGYIFAIQDCDNFEKNMTHILSSGDFDSSLFCFSNKLLNLIPALLGEILCLVLCRKSVLIKVGLRALKPIILNTLQISKALTFLQSRRI